MLKKIFLSILFWILLILIVALCFIMMLVASLLVIVTSPIWSLYALYHMILLKDEIYNDLKLAIEDDSDSDE